MRKRQPSLSNFAATVEREWHKLKLPNDGQTIIVAVSGGADSSSLLMAIDELIGTQRLRLWIIVAHLDHRLRKGSQEDAKWVSELAKKLGYSAIIRAANVRKRASDASENLEQVARRVRYDFFHKVAQEQSAKLVLTAHTLDDQAETVLLRLLRGSAAEGLSGIETVRPIKIGSDVLVARPLLSWARREEGESYCRSRKVRFRVDEMNQDERFARVRVRKQLLPLMQTFNNRIVEALARTASLLREDAHALSDQAESLLCEAKITGEDSDTGLDIPVLQAAPTAVSRRAVRSWIRTHVGDLRRVEMVHLMAIERLVLGNRGGTIELPNGIRVTRKRKVLSVTVKTVEKRGSGV